MHIVLPIPTIIILLVLGIVLWALSWIARELTEYENVFMYVCGLAMLLIIGGAVYLTFAIPTFAQQPSYVSGTSVTTDDSNLLQE
jgi:hypothetical protein